MINSKRISEISEGIIKPGIVVYWMQRDQRVQDNWALLYSQEEAIKKQVPLVVIFNLVPNFLGATIRQYGFMLRGLEQVEKELIKHNITFELLIGDPSVTIPTYINKNNASLLIGDFNPLKNVRSWKKKVAEKIQIPFHEVDAHNIVPCRFVSSKLEFAAYTIRPKIHRLLPEFLDEFPPLKRMKSKSSFQNRIDWKSVVEKLKVDRKIKEIDWLLPGEKAAFRVLENFITNKLSKYNEKRNDPNEDAVSNLSPYLHFGQISSQRVALEIIKSNISNESQQSFLEELIIRKELSDNFCYYNNKYDSFEGFPKWAQETLNKHRKDKREYLYKVEEFENSLTHDNLWNKAQLEMVNKGKMHGYMRMYWAKKILEWSASPEEAIKIAIYLNDKYQLDGRDPNGYTGIAWSIGGVHDRAWTERNIFGKIRYMNYTGCNRKFNVVKYTKSPLY